MFGISVDLFILFKVLVLLVEVAVKSVKLPENVASTWLANPAKVVVVVSLNIPKSPVDPSLIFRAFIAVVLSIISLFWSIFCAFT